MGSGGAVAGRGRTRRGQREDRVERDQRLSAHQALDPGAGGGGDRELRYRPNESARQLKHGRSGFLALAVPQMDAPYFAELASRLSAEAARLGYILLIDTTGADPNAERTVLNGVRSHIIDGLIFSPLALSADEIAARADDLPMVLLGERAVPRGYAHVAVDSVAAARAMTTHLLDLGRRRVAAIGRESGRGTASVRLRGYKRALADAGVGYDNSLVKGVANYQRADGKVAMAELLALDRPAGRGLLLQRPDGDRGPASLCRGRHRRAGRGGHRRLRQYPRGPVLDPHADQRRRRSGRAQPGGDPAAVEPGRRRRGVDRDADRALAPPAPREHPRPRSERDRRGGQFSRAIKARIRSASSFVISSASTRSVNTPERPRRNSRAPRW